MHMSWQSTHTYKGEPAKSAHEDIPRRFAARLHDLYLALSTRIEGIEDPNARKRYASLLLYRLMFMYFLQHMGLLRGDHGYLQRRHAIQMANGGSFYRAVLRPLFTTPTPAQLPLASLFSSCEIEHRYPAIEIADELFMKLFALFDEYRWHVHRQECSPEGVLTPEILGALFERNLHPRELGSYYTPREVTAYIARNTLPLALFTRTSERCPSSYSLEMVLRRALAREPRRFMYEAIYKGYEKPLPPEIVAGLEDTAQRARWRQRASVIYALPGETWRDVVARRARVDEILAHLRQEKPGEFARLISWNVDPFFLALEMVRSYKNPEILLAYYQSLRQLSVLDPTCGSGAFLCAALPLLQDLSLACLARMEKLCTTHNTTDLAPSYRHAFHTYLAEAGTPEQRAYTCLRWIIEHNLYGVDLNAEAVEICRLRLYLKLLAVQPGQSHLPQADIIGQHIRVGNSLLDSPNAQSAHPAPESRDYQQAFHWRQAFPAPMERGGFDVVIGNPPYVEYEHVRQFYKVDGYTTLETGNLYALTVERATHLLAPGGNFGMLVPASATCTNGYRSLQKLLLAQQELHIASFSDQRGHLLALPHPRLCIIFYTRAASMNASKSRVFTTPYIKLGREARASLFGHLNYTEVTSCTRDGLIPRFGSPLEVEIYKKLARQQHVLGAFRQRKGAYPIYFTRKLSWYVQVTPFIPRILDEQGQVRAPSELKSLCFSSQRYARIAFVALNSNLFYWLITTGSDCRNLNMREVQGLPLDLATIHLALQQELFHLADELESDLLKHSRVKPMVFQNRRSLTIQCMYPARSKPLIDEIDRVLARHFAFDAAEIDFLLHYDEKYRHSEPF